jgi:phenylalanyl-tRNA synthetase beta chain
MKFSLEFLKEFVDIRVRPQELARKFTMAGLEIGSLQRVGQDFSFEAEVTSNRPDLLSIVGLSYEAAALVGQKVKAIKQENIKQPPERKDVEIREPRECFFYLGKRIENVKVSSSPSWLKNKLVCCGIKPVNNVVDITNYCMLKWGQPLHAFDLGVIKENIRVRKAKPKERILCLDDKERVLDKESLVIADSEKALAVAGIIGGKESEIKDRTQNIFLEAALFSPLSIRRTRRFLGIDTDSSYRFERSVNPLYLEQACSEAVGLILELTGGRLVSCSKSGRLPKPKPAAIRFSYQDLNQLMGTEIKKSACCNILKSIGCKLNRREDQIVVIPPSFRTDLKIQEDLFEEVSRIWGYKNILPQVPVFTRPDDRETSLYGFKQRLKQKIISLGFKEIVTFSLVNQNHYLIKDKEQQVIRLKNPLRADECLLRPSLHIGMAQVMKYNVFRKQEKLEFFEIADTFVKGEGSFCEVPKLCLGMHSPERKDFFLFKAKINALIRNLGLSSLDWENAGKTKDFSNLCEFKCGSWAGVLDRQASKEAGLENVFLAEFSIGDLFKRAESPVYCKLNEYPWVDRDISLGLKEKTDFINIAKVIKNKTQGLLKEYKVVDIYKGKNIPDGFTGLTLRLSYQHKERTLEAKEVDRIHFDLREALSQEKNLFLR